MTERIAIGKILSPHGIKGEVRVYPWSDDPERFGLLKEVYLSKDGAVRRVSVNSSRSHKNVVILGFAEITTMNEAEGLKDWIVEIEQKDLLPLPEGRFYIFQLMGLKVITVDGRELGKVTEVIQTGANDVYIVKNGSGKEVLIPALKSVVKKVDLAGKEMLVEPLPGLLD